MFVPVGGGDDNAMGKGLFAGRGKEAVDVTFLDAVVVRVELGLDGVKLALAMGFGDEVNTDITTV